MSVGMRQEYSARAGTPNVDTERIYRDWNDALSRNDTNALLALYAPDAELESPLIPHLLGKQEGICRGRAELRHLFEILATRKPEVRQCHRSGYFTDGKILMWEYPDETSAGEQMDFVEVMEIAGGLIQKHRVCWGWYGFNVLKNDQYRH